MRTAGHVTEYALTATKPDKQFKRAQELKAAHTLKLENDLSVKVRNLKTREEKSVGIAEVMSTFSLKCL